MEELLVQIAGSDEVTLTGTAAIIILIFYKSAQLVAKAIPDSKDGFLGKVRKVAKVLSLYVENKK